MLTLSLCCVIMDAGVRNMPRFSRKSLARLSTCLPVLQEIATDAIEVVDFSVVWGHRVKVDQDRMVREGFSRAVWPTSKHNNWPARAFDLAPWPIDWEDRERFFFLAATVLSIARSRGILLRWGGAWSGQLNKDGDFDDLAHYELLD